MPLPKIDVPVHEIELISSKKKVKFRPFLVKEQKLFLMTNESAEAADIINTIRQVIKNCVLTDIDVDALPMFDLEYLFLNMRARSVSEVVNLKYQCNNKITNEETKEERNCGMINEINVNLLEIKPEASEKVSNKIQLTDNVGIVMKYPTFEMTQKVAGKTESELVTEMIYDCVDYIYDKDSIYHAKDVDRQEVIDFIDGLQQKEMLKIQSFFENMPKMSKDVEYNCGRCGYKETIKLEGIQNFFG
jgi:hypothetical protein